MATFYEIHERHIRRAFQATHTVGDIFRIIMLEPLVISNDPPSLNEEWAYFITFRRLQNGRYELAGPSDRKLAEDFNKRHEHTPAAAWELPELICRAVS